MVYQPGLGVDLRNLRKRSGMSTRSVADRIGISHSSVARTELGSRSATVDEVIALCALYGVTGRQRERLIERARGDKSGKTWFGSGVAADQISSLVELEMEASTITDVDLTLIPGLVQTSEYAREIIGRGRMQPHEIEWLVRTRMSRQSLLSQPRAPELHLIIDETVLLRRVGGAGVMRDQMDQLLRVGRRPNVTIQVIPLEVGAHPAIDGTFVMMTFPERDTHIYIESRRGALFLSEQEQVEPYAEVIEDLEQVMLGVEGSAKLIAEIRETVNDDRVGMA